MRIAGIISFIVSKLSNLTRRETNRIYDIGGIFKN
jgi:hypothetical protein